VTRGRRTASEEERELFETALADAKPLTRTARPRRKTPSSVTPATQPPKDNRPKPAVHRDSAGIDGNTADRLRRGLLEPQARLDLHGLTEQTAHRALVTFLRTAAVRKLRLLLVVTGKGDARTANAQEQAFDLELDRRRRGVLRTMTPRWLKEPGLAELIADTREAHRRHGGSGALYVYLRKP
jgi:DNA-nicking Smr family endonuclease